MLLDCIYLCGLSLILRVTDCTSQPVNGSHGQRYRVHGERDETRIGESTRRDYQTHRSIARTEREYNDPLGVRINEDTINMINDKIDVPIATAEEYDDNEDDRERNDDSDLRVDEVPVFERDQLRSGISNDASYLSRPIVEKNSAIPESRTGRDAERKVDEYKSEKGDSNENETTNYEESRKENDIYRNRIEEEIERKIESIKDEIKREIEEKEKIDRIESNNAKYEEIQRGIEREEQRRENRRNVEDNSKNIGKILRDEVTKIRRSNDIEETRKKRKKRDSRKREIRRYPLSWKREKENGRESIDAMKAMHDDTDESYAEDNSGNFLFTGFDRVEERKSMRNKRAEHDGDERKGRVDVRGTKRRTRNHAKHRVGKISIETKERARDRRSNIVSGSIASLTGSSQELSPRLATEYKEAFGGLRTDSNGARIRYKRVKRVIRRS